MWETLAFGAGPVLASDGGAAASVTIALWISQLIVFAAFPLLLRARPRLLPLAASVAAVACALGGYGLYLAISNTSGT